MSKIEYIALLPVLAVLALVEIYPLVYSSYLSAISPNGGFAGFANYVQIVSDLAFLNSLGISLLYSTGSTLLALAIGLSFAFLLQAKIRGRAIFEGIFIVPLAIAPIVTGILWSPSALWDDANTFIHFILRLPYVDVLSPYFFFPVMMISDAWEWAPLIMLVALSMISSIPREVFEAASLHGASPLGVFRHITLPTVLESPVMQFVLVLRFIDAMRAFEIPFAWSAWVGFQKAVGSPADTLSLYLFKLMFVPSYNFPAPIISAGAMILLVVTLVGAAILLRFMRVVGRLT